MNMNTVARALNALSNEQLMIRLKSLAARERSATAELVAHLAELEGRRLHLEAGYPSMYAYCRDVLLLTENEAYNRIEAARAARRFPLVLDLLLQGAVTLTAVRLLAPHLTADNHVAVLQSARGLARSQVEELAARLAPRPDVPATVRKLPSPNLAPSGALPPVSAAAVDAPPCATPPTSAPAPPPRPAVVSALSPDRYKLQVTIGGETLQKLRQAQDLLRHALPSGDIAAVVDRALTALVADLTKKKFATSARPRPSRGVARDSRRIAADVRRAVSRRDGGQCAYLSPNGHRCRERTLLEFHHVRPFAHGGPPTVENIELRCRQHNRYEWEREMTAIRAWETEALAARARGTTRVDTASLGP